MTPPRNTALRHLLPFALLAVVALGPIANAQPPAGTQLTAEMKQKVLETIGFFMTKAYAPGADFTKWPQYRDEQKDVIEKAQNPTEFVTAVNGALGRFGVSHVFLRAPQQPRGASSPSDLRALVEPALGKRLQGVGIGVTVRGEREGLRVAILYRDSPADKAGVVVGDLILEVDGKAPDNGSLWNSDGKEVKVKIRRADGTTKELVLKQTRLNPLRVDSLLWPTSDAAVLKVHSFDVGYDGPRIEGFMRQAVSAKYLILDLRSNPGGKITNMAHLLGMFLKEGTPIGTLVSRQIVDQYVKETNGSPNDTVKIAKWTPSKLGIPKSAVPVFAGRVAVLIDAAGSTAEMAAAALQDLARAQLVGSARTSGSVLASYMANLPYGYTLVFPVMDYVTIKGVRLEGKGVVPDVYSDKVAATIGPGPDQAIDKAIAALKK